MTKTRIVVVGGGFGGVFTARELMRLNRGRFEIELINPTNYMVFQPLLPEVAAGVISAADAVVPLRAMLKGVKVRQAKVIDIDFPARKIDLVQGAGRYDNQIDFDHLVVAIGQQVAVDRIPGVAEHALTIKNLTDAFRLRNHVLNCLELADVTTRPELKRRYLSFVVVGGGFSGVETIGELEELVGRSLHYYPSVTREEIQFTLVEFGPRLLPDLPETLATYSTGKLEDRGIEVRLNVGLKAVTSGDVELTDGSVLPSATVVATVGNGPSDLLTKLDLPLVGGKIAVDRHLQVQGAPNVWALGDAARIPLDDGQQAFAPPTAQFAVREARLLARNIAACIEARPLEEFAYRSKGSLASLGVQKGVAELFGVKLTGFPAWLLWRGYYLSILPNLATKVRVATNWALGTILPRNTVQSQHDSFRGTRVFRYRRGETLFSTGMHYDGLYVVLEGRVSIEIDGTRRDVGPGQYFGEQTMIAGIRARGVSRVEEDSRILVLRREDFFALRDALPFFREQFGSGAAQETGDVPIGQAASCDKVAI